MYVFIGDLDLILKGISLFETKTYLEWRDICWRDYV